MEEAECYQHTRLKADGGPVHEVTLAKAHSYRGIDSICARDEDKNTTKHEISVLWMVLQVRQREPNKNKNNIDFLFNNMLDIL